MQLCSTKSAEDLRNLMAARISQHQQAEQERLDAEREKIRKEEEARAQKAAAAASEQQPEPVAGAPAAAAVRTPPTAVASVPAPSAAPREVVKIKLGQVVDLIAPLKIDAEGLRQLGFEPVSIERGSKLYDASQIDAMRGAMIRHLQQPLPDTYAQAA